MGRHLVLTEPTEKRRYWAGHCSKCGGAWYSESDTKLRAFFDLHTCIRSPLRMLRDFVEFKARADRFAEAMQGIARAMRTTPADFREAKRRAEEIGRDDKT